MKRFFGMTDRQIEDAFWKWRNHDCRRCEAQIGALYLGLARATTRDAILRYGKRFCPEEMTSELLLFLTRIAPQWDARRGVPLRCYLSYRARLESASIIRSLSFSAATKALSEETPYKDDNTLLNIQIALGKMDEDMARRLIERASGWTHEDSARTRNEVVETSRRRFKRAQKALLGFL